MRVFTESRFFHPSSQTHKYVLLTVAWQPDKCCLCPVELSDFSGMVLDEQLHTSASPHTRGTSLPVRHFPFSAYPPPGQTPDATFHGRSQAARTPTSGGEKQHPPHTASLGRLGDSGSYSHHGHFQVGVLRLQEPKRQAACRGQDHGGHLGPKNPSRPTGYLWQQRDPRESPLVISRERVGKHREQVNFPLPCLPCCPDRL